MARDRDGRDSRYHYDDYYSDDDRERERRHRRRHRHRDDDEYARDKRERRRRREDEERRRRSEIDLDELRARRESYYSRPEPERRRERDSQRMAHEVTAKSKSRSSGHRTVRKDGTVRRKKRSDRVEDDRSDDYVYDRPKSSGVVEEVVVRRSSAPRRSDEGGSSRRTNETMRSGSGSRSTGESLRRAMEVPKLSRSASAREPTKSYMGPRPVRRTSTIKLPTVSATPVTRTASVRESVRSPGHKRTSTGGLLATFFRPPVRAPSITVVREVPRVECLVCMVDDLPASKTAKLSCGHRMCHSCLKRQFNLSVSDPQHMPPTCCNAEHIPLKHVERLFDDKFKRLWNKKYQEYTTANRLYCPTRGCGEWIKPSKIRVDITGRKYARCGRCDTKVCVLCNGRFHSRRECPRDDETNRFVELAKEKGWQKCYNCKAMVELKEGCNHMTCRCTAQFCMLCAAPWKTCNCPWFNYTNLDEGDRLNEMRVPYIQPDNVVEVIEAPAGATVRRSSTRVRRHDDRDRDRADAALAAHLQAQMHLNPTPTASDIRRSEPAVQVYGLGNSGGHHMNESYTVRPLATSAARTAVHRATPRLFSRRSVRETVRPPPPRAMEPAQVRASAMAGLSRDGTRRGAGRVGTWLQHVELDRDAVDTAPQHVEVDHWHVEGSMVGVD